MDLPLFNKFSINNRTIGVISSFELLKRKNDIIVPYSQRMSDSSKVKEILEYQREYKMRHNCYNYLGVINFHFCHSDKKYYLVDGQHRYLSITELVSELEDFKVVIEIVEIDKPDDLVENYNLINKNTPLPELSENINKLTHKIVFQYFEDKFSMAWKSSASPRRPYLNKNHFQEAISYLMEQIKVDDHNKMIKLIEEHNKRVSKWDLNRIGNMKVLKNPQKTFNLCGEIGCYLGLFPHTSDEFHYRWVSDIIRIETGIEKKSKIKKIKRAIPKQLRKDLWNKYVGENIGATNCLVCNREKISQMGFVVGHILAESHGGKNTIDNLRPICSGCNLSMATRNMMEYTEEYYPENILRLELGVKQNENLKNGGLKKISL